MADSVELAFLRAAEVLLPAECAVLAAVSGGGDSVALLHLLADLARRRPLRLGVAHLDHGLRRGARGDRAFVERLARRLGLPCFAERRDVGALRRADESPEEAARRVRRAFLEETARREDFERIALGHNLDDQAETVLLRLVRGAGATAIGGMAPAGPGPFVRPLLELERAGLRRWLARRDLAYRDDPSNGDLRFDRNRARARVVPLLAAELNPRAARHLVRAARTIRDDAVHLDTEAERLAAELARAAADGGVRIDARRLAGLPPVLARRVARLALRRAGVDPRRVTAAHLEGFVELARGPAGRELHLPGRRRGRRGRRHVSIEPHLGG